MSWNKPLNLTVHSVSCLAIHYGIKTVIRCCSIKHDNTRFINHNCWGYIIPQTIQIFGKCFIVKQYYKRPHCNVIYFIKRYNVKNVVVKFVIHELFYTTLQYMKLFKHAFKLKGIKFHLIAGDNYRCTMHGDLKAFKRILFII